MLVISRAEMFGFLVLKKMLSLM